MTLEEKLKEKSIRLNVKYMWIDQPKEIQQEEVIQLKDAISICKQEIEDAKPKWISIKDKLPEIGEEVIVYCPKCISRKVTALMRLIRYEGATEYFWDNSYGGSNVHVMHSVTHWMPLPESPKESEL